MDIILAILGGIVILCGALALFEYRISQPDVLAIAHPLQGVYPILRADIARWHPGKRTSAQPAKGRFKISNPAAQGRHTVGEA